MCKALLVIDMQNVCVGEQHAAFFQYDNELLIQKVNEKIESYESGKVIYILNMMKRNLINRFAPFSVYPGSEEAKLAPGLKVVNNHWIEKYTGNAFCNPLLPQLLQEMGIQEVELVGVDGGGCVPQTALGALKYGLRVTIVAGAVGTIFIAKAEKYRKKLQRLGVIYQDERRE